MKVNIGDTVQVTNDDSPYYNLVGEVISCVRDEFEVYLGQKYGWGMFENSELEYIC